MSNPINAFKTYLLCFGISLFAGSTLVEETYADTIFVSNYTNSTIVQFDSTSAVNLGSLTSGLNNNAGITFDKDHNLYVSNFGNNKIVRFTYSSGTLSLTSSIYADVGLNNPESIAIDSNGNLFVPNRTDNTIKEFPFNGGVYTFASGLSGPQGAAFDSAGNLFVGNSTNSSIVKFPFTGGTLSSTSTAFANSGLSFPYQIAFDSAGNLYAANINSNTIEKFPLVNGVLSSTGTTFASGLHGPAGLAFDSDGNLYVGNAGNNTIIKFPFSAGSLSSSELLFATGLNGPYFITALNNTSDLTVTSLHAQKLTGGKFLCSFKVTNSGTGTAPASKATITGYKSKNPATGKGTLIKTFNIPSLAAGAVSAKFQTRVTQGASKFCIVDLDTADVVLETNEVNNRLAKKIL